MDDSHKIIYVQFTKYFAFKFPSVLWRTTEAGRWLIVILARDIGNS